MIAQFILIVVFASGDAMPAPVFAGLGEFNSMANCQAAANASLKAHNTLGVWQSAPPKFICAAKGKQ